MNTLLSSREMRQYLRVSRSTLHKWVTQGAIPTVKIENRWMFDKGQIDRWFLEHENMNMEKVGKTWIPKIQSREGNNDR